MSNYATVWYGVVATGAGPIAAGLAVVPAGNGTYVVATAANRALYGRSVGIARTTADSGKSFQFQVAGPHTISSTGAANDYVRVNASGNLERTASPAGSDDLIGRCPHTGTTVMIQPVLTQGGGGGGGSTPTGTGFRRVTADVEDAAASAVNLAGGATHVTGTLPVGNGGTGAVSHAANRILLGDGASPLKTFTDVQIGDATTYRYLSLGGTTGTPASDGTIRLGHDANGKAGLYVRNEANTANIRLIRKTETDIVVVGDDTAATTQIAAGTTIGGYVGGVLKTTLAASLFSLATGVDLAMGAAPSSSGNIRLANALTCNARNFANSGNIRIFTVDASDRVVIGTGANTAVTQIIGGTGNEFLAASHSFRTAANVEHTLLTETNAQFVGAQITLGSGGPTITRGAGVPASTPADGSIWLRTDGTASTGIYTRQAGAWSAVGGGATSFSDAAFEITDDGDATKKLAFECSGITTGTTRTLTVPNASTTIVGTDATQTLTNKTVSGPSFAASSHLAVGTSATTGHIRLPTAGTIFGVGPGPADAQLLRYGNAGGYVLELGETVMVGTLRLISSSAGAVQIEPGGTVRRSISNTLDECAVPRVGYGSTPYASEGRAAQAMADADQTAAAGVYSRAIIRTTGALTATRTLTLPLPANEDASYIKHIMQDCTGGSVAFKAGAHATTVTVAAAARAVLAFTPDGVFQIAS